MALDLDTLLELRTTDPFSYETYLDLMEQQAAAAPAPDDPEAAERVEYTKLNLQRSRRIARTWRPSPELLSRLDALPVPQTWLVLTEPWCGDSAQCLPCVAVMAAHRAEITLQVLLRDANPAIMDRFLTEGKRGIPVVAMFDAAGTLVTRWGPRPALAQDVFTAAKREGLPKPAILERLHLWYGRDRGRALDAEFRALLASAGAMP